MLDNDELIATRKLHGQDDGLYEETSDKNVVTEEDLEELNEVLLHHRETEQVRIAIKHILSELEQKDKRIQELEEDLMDSIPKQVVIDKVNEINKKYEDSKDENGESPYYYPDFTIRILQGFLKGEK